MAHEDTLWFIKMFLSAFGASVDKKLNFLIVLLASFGPLLMWYLAIYQLFHHDDISFETWARVIETIITSTHFLMKYAILICNYKKLHYLVKETKNFLSVNDLNEAFQQSYNKDIQFIKYVGNAFVSTVFLGTFTFPIGPIINYELVFVCYVPDCIPTQIFRTLNGLSAIPMGLFIAGFDLFAFTFISLLTSQIKILNKRISLLGIGESNNDDRLNELVLSRMKIWIDSYNFFDSYLNTMNEIFGLAAFLQSLIFMSSMCFELYLISRTENLVDMIKASIYIYLITSEIIICWCRPATGLTEEFSNTPFCLYDTKWYNCLSIPVKKSVLIMMMRSQKDTFVSYRHMFVVNMETYTNAFNTAYSYFMVLKTMEQKYASN